VQISSKGELIVLTPADERFLSWPQHGHLPRDRTRLIMNPFVLTEVTFLFADYVKTIYDYGSPSPSSVLLFVGLERMKVGEDLPILGSHEVKPFAFHEGEPAPDYRKLLCVEVPFQTKVERMAFLLRAQLYRWFGFSDDQIPYADGEDEGRVTRVSDFKPASSSS
jgi:hypothetical protein